MKVSLIVYPACRELSQMLFIKPSRSGMTCAYRVRRKSWSSLRACNTVHVHLEFSPKSSIASAYSVSEQRNSSRIAFDMSIILCNDGISISVKQTGGLEYPAL